MQVSRRERERGRQREQRPGHPHPLNDLTSSRCPSLFSSSASGGGCWATGLSDSASMSVTAVVLGSDTSLQDRNYTGESLCVCVLDHYRFEDNINHKLGK